MILKVKSIFHSEDWSLLNRRPTVKQHGQRFLWASRMDQKQVLQALFPFPSFMIHTSSHQALRPRHPSPFLQLCRLRESAAEPGASSQGFLVSLSLALRQSFVASGSSYIAEENSELLLLWLLYLRVLGCARVWGALWRHFSSPRITCSLIKGTHRARAVTGWQQGPVGLSQLYNEMDIMSLVTSQGSTGDKLWTFCS